jgi:apolipoprotein D and lipocalin family protein
MASRKFVVAGGVVVATGAAVVAMGLIRRHPKGNSSVPEPAKPVDLEQYLGHWFEIARYEQIFQKGCEAVTADYSLRDDGTITVINRCRKPDGAIDQVRGRAKVVDRKTRAKLKVSFFGPFYGNYWVLDHADDYSWSIVGEPSGRYLWILARAATPPEPAVHRLIDRAKSLGYDTSMLRRTRQP